MNPSPSPSSPNSVYPDMNDPVSENPCSTSTSGTGSAPSYSGGTCSTYVRSTPPLVVVIPLSPGCAARAGLHPVAVDGVSTTVGPCEGEPSSPSPPLQATASSTTAAQSGASARITLGMVSDARFHPSLEQCLPHSSLQCDHHSRSPVAFRVLPSSLYQPMVFRAIVCRCTSSAPSTSRAERALRSSRSSGVSVEYPSAPCTWIARSTVRHSVFATWYFAIATSCLNGIPFSMRYAACITISFAAYISSTDSEIIHWIACLSASNEPCVYRFSARSTIISSATSALPIHRMQCPTRAGPSRYCPSR